MSAITIHEMRALGLSDEFFRMCEYSRCHCDAGVEERNVGRAQAVFEKPGARRGAMPGTLGEPAQSTGISSPGSEGGLMIGVVDVLQANALAVAGCMLALWLVSLAIRDASIVDIFWGLGFVVIAAISFLWTNDGSAPRRLLVACMAGIWGLRLSGYLFWRNAGHAEDPRYGAMRRRFGSRFPWISLFTVFGLQGVVMFVVSLPVQLAQIAPGGSLGLLDAFGVALWLVGMVFESLGDAQLARFRADPANSGKVMERGLWRYTRHPNYFGDFCVWWGIFLVALSTPYGLASVVGPLLMSFFLMRVSGVPMLERTIHKRRPGYTEYAARTSAFFPRPPKSLA